MKYAFMTFSCPDLNLDQVLDTAKRYGYDGVEPRIDKQHGHGIELETDQAARKEAKEKSRAKGVALACLATSCRYADPATGQENVDRTLKSIDLAADVGAPAIRVFGGQFPPSVSREEATDLVTRALSLAAERARARDVVVCMETHDAWCNPHDVAQVMSRVNDPYVAVNWDIMHPVRMAGVSVDEAFETLRQWTRHVHFHDGVTEDRRMKLVPVGEGEVDHRRAVELLQSARYEGYLSGEWIGWEPYATHLPRELAAMKSYERG